MKRRKLPSIGIKTEISFQLFFLLNTKAFDNFNKNRGNILKRFNVRLKINFLAAHPSPRKNLMSVVLISTGFDNLNFSSSCS